MDHHHQHSLKNSNHATTSTTSSTLTSTMTATQMRATLIYLAPFLQPCKNVVPGTTTTTTTAATTSSLSSTTRAQHLQQHNKNNNEKDIAAILDKTHVARNRASASASVGVSVSSSRNNHNNAINCNSNNNNTNQSIINASRRCCSNSLNCTTDTTGSSRIDGCNIAISSSCCHNTTQHKEKVEEQQHQHQHHHQDSKQVKQEPNKTQRDTEYYYENYEMPALETTTNSTTTTIKTTMLNSTNNKIRQQQQQQKQHPVVAVVEVAKEVEIAETNTKQDNPSLSLQTSSSSSCFSSSPSSSPSSSTSALASTSFVNYTNNRSTKYLRERVRRHSTTQQTLKQQTHDLTVTATLQLPAMRQEEMAGEIAKENVKEQEKQLQLQQQQKQQQQRKSPCGRSPDKHIATRTTTALTKHCNNRLDNDNNRTTTNNSINSNTSVLSRCHCSNNQHNNIMLTNVQDMKKEQMMQTQIQTKTSTICDGQKDEQWEEEEVEKEVDNDMDNVDRVLESEQVCLILRNSQREQQQQQNNSYLLDYKDRNEQELFYTENDLTTSATRNSYYSSTPLSSLALTPSSVTLSSTTTTTSYTTILNKECRCFRNKRDIINGSECNIVQIKTQNQNQIQNQKKFGGTSSTGVATSSAASLSETYCMINDKRGGSVSMPSSFVSGWCQWLVASFGCSQLTKTVAVSKWLFMWLLFVMLTTSAHCWAGRNEVPTNCTFPARWEGSWFLSGYQQSIHIKGSQFSYRGRCAASDGNKYLIVDEKGCHRCLVIYEKHKNVLQYKESECEGDSMYMHQTNPSAMAMRSVLNQKTNNNGGDHRGGAHPNLNGHSRLSSSDQYIMRSNDDMNDYFCKGRETLQNLCDQIPGDALLYSLFRESAEPVKCPLKGPFIFTYNRGNGECKSPVSNIESCTEDSRLLLSFQACPDVVGTESTVEELTCLATWKDGNSRYLVGLVSHHHAISNEERYRCFVYEKISSLMDLGHFAGPSMSTSKDAEYKLAQSGDATCNGLDSAEVGSRIMSLRKPPITERCDFPVWFKGPRHWHVLMGNAVYNYHTNDGSIHIIKPNGYMETRALCEQINKQTPTEMMSVVHYTTGCQSGFMCMMFYRRDTHVIEIQTGKPASRLEDACAPDHFDILKTPYITLLASNPDPQICPMEGLYSLKGAIGPPYLTTRHKRNHNNKIHGLHNHHHQIDSLENAGRGYLHKRHSSLSFRNSQHDEKNAWHSNTRGLPIRSRRDASSTAIPQASSNQTQEILVVGNNTNVGFVQDPDSDTRLRSRRNVPECVTNYKAQRQLWVGCTEPNVIDVRPLCNDEGDEEYSCHGSWSENSTVYIIARHKGTKHGVCISYRPTEGTSAKLVVGDACYRGTQKPPEHHLVANLSVFGKCGETGSTSSTIPVVSWRNLFISTILIIFVSQLPIQR